MTGASSLARKAPRPQVVRTLIRRDFLISRSYRLALVMDIVVGVFNLLLYYFISRTFGTSTTADLDGAPSYFAFAAVGVTLSLVVQAASARVAARMREEQLTGTLEALVAQPTTATELALGFAGFQYVFGMARATIYLLVAGLWLDVDLSQANWFGFGLVLVATGIAMTSVGIVFAALVLVLKRAEVAIGLATLGISLLGGAFFPIAVLPGWAETVATVIPTRFAFEGVRAALFGGDGWRSDTLALLGFSVVGLPAAIALFKLSLELARRRGSLTSY